MSTVKTVRENGRDIITVRFDNTEFMWATNFAGDPDRDRFKGTSRFFNIVIPDESTTEELERMGCNVRHHDEVLDEDGNVRYEAKNYIRVNVNLNPPAPIKAPTVRLIIDGKKPVLLDEETISMLDGYSDSRSIQNVNCYCSIREEQHTLYVKSLAVEVEEPYDPYEYTYQSPDDDEEMPF